MTNNQWIVVGIGGVAFVLGVVFIIMGVLARRKLNAMKEAPTVKAAQAAQMGDPSGMSRVELFGTAQSVTPLTSPASGRECVYYRHHVERMNSRTVTDSNGYTHEEQSWDTVLDDRQGAPFTVRDETGEIPVATRGAEFVAQQTMSDAPGAYGMENRSQGLSVGGAMGGVLDTAMDFLSSNTGYYRTSEWIIPTGLPVYVLGNLFRTQAGVQVAQGDGPFIVSYKSEEELTSKYNLHFVLWTVFGVLFGCGGIAAAIYGTQYMKK
ncbi:MAG: GIDE domain-containing protein [Candidatus Geothermincolia bacterium]